jgi:hypothetical protein
MVGHSYLIIAGRVRYGAGLTFLAAEGRCCSMGTRTCTAPHRTAQRRARRARRAAARRAPLSTPGPRELFLAFPKIHVLNLSTSKLGRAKAAGCLPACLGRQPVTGR